ncbi:MAG: lysophospholipid acyltransferase family protein [Crocinitomicaceae bacterium]
MKDFFKRWFYRLIVRPWLTVFIGVKYVNRDVFKGKDQFILVANHNSHFDVVSIIAGMPGDKIKNLKTLVAGDYFGRTNVARSLTDFFFNAIMIYRDRKDENVSGVEVLDQVLKNGDSLVLFPEGSRGKPGVIAEFKSGIAILLKNNPDIPFIPVYLDGFGRVLPKDKTIILPMECKVRFGKPIYIDKSKEMEDILDDVKNAILGLKIPEETDRNQFTFQHPEK